MLAQPSKYLFGKNKRISLYDTAVETLPVLLNGKSKDNSGYVPAKSREKLNACMVQVIRLPTLAYMHSISPISQVDVSVRVIVT